MTTLEEARAYVIRRGVGLDIARHADLRVGTGDLAGRVVLPWRSKDGRECYVTGRALNGRTPKYLHSRGHRPALYASPEAWEAERVALVEGHMDALVCASAGTSAFATAGSSLSDAAVAILATKQEIVLVPDADEAGARWLEQAVEKLSGRVPRLSRATVPEGCKDVTDVAERALSRGEDPVEATAEVLYSAELVDVPWLTSWGPDTSEGKEGPPALLARSDGECLLYVGKLHWFQGEPESGKTFAAVAGVAEQLRAGSVVVFIDFEDSRTAVLGRLHAMNADTTNFIYVRPTEPLEDKALLDVERLMELGPSVVVLDGIAEAMALHGLDPIRSVDTATFVHEVLDHFRGPGISTIVIDHVARGDAGKGRYAYGSQHKLASVDGAAYRFEVIQAFSREQGGAARIDVAKDRPGYVRSFAHGKERAGVLRVVPGEDSLDVFIEPPMSAAADDDDGLSYTQRRVFAVLEPEGETGGLTYREIGDRLASDGRGMPLKSDTIRKAIDAIIELGLADGSRSTGRDPSRFWRTSDA